LSGGGGGAVMRADWGLRGAVPSRGAARTMTRFRLKTDYLTFARDQVRRRARVRELPHRAVEAAVPARACAQIRGGLWYKPAWWDAVQKAPPTFQPRVKKRDIPHIAFVEDRLLRCGRCRRARAAPPRRKIALALPRPPTAASLRRATRRSNASMIAPSRRTGRAPPLAPNSWSGS